MNPTTRPFRILSLVIAAGLPAAALASSHSDAPSIKLDPQANLTDVYAFIGTSYGDDATPMLNVVVNVRPFSEPGDGPHYERFDPDALYSIHITDPATGVETRRYDFTFSGVDENYKNTGTILSYGLGTAAGPIVDINDAQQNFAQFYDITRTAANAPLVILDDALVCPPNVGGRVTPLYNDEFGKAISGAQTVMDLDPYTQQAVHETPGGEVFFAGPRDDSFYADVPGTFDLLNARILDNDGSLADGLGQDGGGVDGFKGFNVLTYAVQIPLDILITSEYNDAFFGPQSGVGVFASVSRRETTTRSAFGDGAAGDWVQVNRLANPLFNEVLVPLADKDNYNRALPEDDAQFAQYAQNSELAGLINFVFGTAFETAGRADLEAVYIPDVLRVSTDTGPVRLDGDPGFSRFGFVGGDTAETSTGGTVSSGWPNGRRFGDDVIDIALTAVASGPSYAEITVVGDNVAGNDIAFHSVFPYAATPHSGSFNRKDPALTPAEVADVNRDGVFDLADVQAFVEAFVNASDG